MVEAARVAIQAMAAARAERTQNVGPILCGLIMQQLTFNWEAEDKYNEHKNLRHRGDSMPQAEQLEEAYNFQKH